MKKISTLVLSSLFTCSIQAQNWQKIKDVNPGSDHSLIQGIDVYNNNLLFHAEANSSRTLWTSDGTTSGTTDLQAPCSHDVFTIKHFYNYNGDSYYINNEKLWKTNGTVAGTQQVSNAKVIRIIGAFLNKLFLEVEDPTTGTEVWTTDGTSSGTTLLKDINPNSDYTNVQDVEMVEFNGKVLFNKDDAGTNNQELWTSDGTTSGTQKLMEINASAGSYPRNFIQYNNVLYFCAYSSVGLPSSTAALWKTDGTSSGTSKVVDLRLTGVKSNFLFNNKLYISGSTYSSTGTIPNIWTSDGTASGTQHFVDDFRTLGILNNQLFLAKDSVAYYALYVTDGTIPSITKLAVVDTTSGSYGGFTITHFDTANGRGYFLTTIYDLNHEYYSYLWETDGTIAGTKQLTPDATLYDDPYIHFAPVYGRRFVKLGNEFYMPYWIDANEGYELYKFTPPPPAPTSSKTISKEALTIYPNPTVESVTLSFGRGSIRSLQLVNTMGQLVAEYQIEKNTTRFVLSMKDQPSGMYLIKLTDADGNAHVERVIKQL